MTDVGSAVLADPARLMPDKAAPAQEAIVAPRPLLRAGARGGRRNRTPDSQGFQKGHEILVLLP